MATAIKFCTCENKYQDEKHGKQKRLMNQTLKSNGTIYRCTVCGKEQS